MSQMHQRIRHLMLLSCLAVVVLSTAFWLQWRKSHPKASADVNLLFGFLKPEDITEIDITNKHGAFHLVRDGVNWRLEKPVYASADAVVAEALARHLAALRRVAQVDGSVDLGKVGLNPAQVTVMFKTRQQGSKTFYVGYRSRFNDMLYAQLVGHPEVLLLPGSLDYQIGKDLQGWQQK